MESKGSVSLLRTCKVTEWTFNNGGYVALLFGGFLITGCLLAYIVAVARGSVEPFLPLVSDAAGSPPQNGLFGTFVTLGGMIGVIFMLLRYMIVMEKNREKSKMVTSLNKLSLFTGILSMLAITIITGYPVNFYRNKDVWLTDVGIPHMIGGVAFFSFGIMYIAIQSIITLFLQTKNKATLVLRVLICIGCCVTFVYHVVTVPDHFGGLSKMYYLNASGEIPNDTSLLPYPATMGSSLKLPIDTSGTYLSSAITEWLLVILFCCFFFTFFKEGQQYSLLIVVETHSPQVENIHDIASDPTNKNAEVPFTGRRESEVKTVFRRDSTCQTMADDVESVVSTKPSFTTFQKGKYTKRQISSFDMLSGDKLEKLIESHVKNKKKDGTKTDSGYMKNLSNGVKSPETINEVEQDKSNGGVQTNGDLENSSQVNQNGVSNEVSETRSDTVAGTTDRGC